MLIQNYQGANAPAVVSDNTADLLKNYAINPNTERAYKSDLSMYHCWLSRLKNSSSLPHNPGVIADYLVHLDDIDKSISTIRRHVQAISWVHRLKGHDTPPTRSAVVKKTVEAIIRRRNEQERQVNATSKTPATVDIIIAMVGQCDTASLIGKRDKALLLLGFSGAFRRSELVNLRAQNISINIEGADIRLQKSKTDQIGRGEVVSITRGQCLESCPVASVVDWMNAAGIESGPLFRPVRKGDRLQSGGLSDRTVARIVKNYALGLGLNPAAFSGHSLRSGMLTSAAESGADLIQLAQHARHKDVNQTMHYIRHANRYKNNPTAGLL